MGEISHRIFKIGGLIIIIIVTVLALGISYATLCIIIPATSGTVYLSQKEYSDRQIRQSAAVHGRRMRNLSIVERQRDWNHRRGSSTTSAEGTPHSISGYNSQPSTMSTPGLSHVLPRVRRLNRPTSTMSRTSTYSAPLMGAVDRTIMTAQRRYPTPLAQYSNLSALPTVHLHRPNRHVLSERNSRMVASPVTVKIAPADVLKPPTPVLLHFERRDVQPEDNPCDTSSVLSAIREKRKRTMREEEAVSPSTDWTQASKRRREEQAGTPNGDTGRIANGGVGMDMPQGHKRVASSQTADSVTDDDDVRTPKRSRRMSGETYGVRNPIDVSYSSSRRWLQRKVRERSASLSRASSVMSSGSQDTGPPNMSDGGIAGSSGASTPRRFYGLSDDDEDMATCERTSSYVVRQTCARLDGSEHEAVLRVHNPDDSHGDPERPGSRKKSTPRGYDVRPHSTLIDNIVKVPHLRYELTVKDYAADRQAEMDRVQQMLNEVDDENDKDGDGATERVLPPGVQFTTETATPTKSLFPTSSPPSCATQSAAASAGFVLPSVSKPKTSAAGGVTGASWSSTATATSLASKPVTAAAAPASSRVPGTTTTDSLSSSQSFTAGTSKQSSGESQSFNATTSATSGAAVSSNNTTASPSYSFKPVFSVPTPTGDEPKLTQPAAPSGARQSSHAPTLETMLRSSSPGNPPGGSSSQTFVPNVGHGLETLFDASKPSPPYELPTLLNRTTTPLVAAESQTLLNGGTDTFKPPVVSSAPVIAFGAPNKASAVPAPTPFGFSAPSVGGVKKTSSLSVATAAAPVSNSTYQFGAAPATAAPMFGGGSAPVTNNVGASGSTFGHDTSGVSASKPDSGVAKSLFGGALQTGMFSNAATTTATSAGGFTFGASKPGMDAPRPATTFGLPPPVNNNPVSATFPPLQNGGASVTTTPAFGAATSSSAQGAAFQFGAAPKATSAPSFKPVFNFNQTSSQTPQPAPFGATSASVTTPFKGFGQSTFSVDSPPVTTGSVFGTPTPAPAFGGANTFATSTEPKPFGVSSSFGSGQAQPPVGAGFGATSASANFQFGGSTGQSVFTFGQGQQSASGTTAAPAFGSSSSFSVAPFGATPATPGGSNMFSLGAAQATNRPRATARPARRRVPRR